MISWQIARAESTNGCVHYLAAAAGEAWHDVSGHCASWADLLSAAQEEVLSTWMADSPHVDLGERGWRLALPFEAPGRFYGVALNFASRAQQVLVDLPDRPFIFTKEASSLVGSGEDVVLPDDVAAHLEGEIGVVVTVGGAQPRATGLLSVNDMTFPQRLGPAPGSDWFNGKNLTRTTTLGPFVVVDGTTEDPTKGLSLVTRLNGVDCQRTTGAELHHGYDAVLAYLSERVQLQVGDVISLGTPRSDLDGRGHLPLCDGDRVEVDVEGLPTVELHVRVF